MPSTSSETKISELGILCLSQGLTFVFIVDKHTTNTLPLHISRPNAFFHKKTAHNIQMKMFSLIEREVDVYAFLCLQKVRR